MAHVVILNATDPYLPAFIALDRGLRDVVRQTYGARVQFHAETLDMHRFPPALFSDELVSVLSKKYRNLPVDVVVTVAPIALDFVQRYGARIWPDAAIVFHSVPTNYLRQMDLGPRTVGVPVELAYGPTIDLALKLRPGTRQIIVIAGEADPDRRHLSQARAALERHAGTLDIQYLVDLSLADTLAALQGLPGDSVVLFLAMFRDGTGQPLVPRDVLTRIAAVSNVPVFGVFETFLGDGIAAGEIVPFEAQGRKAGELVVRLLNGERPSAIGVQAPLRPRCIADWRQLRRWDIDERALPENCEIRFWTVTAWDKYRWEIIGALAIILGQAALIVAIALSRRKLARTEGALAGELVRRTEAESLAKRFRARLDRFSRQRTLGVMTTFLSHEINQPLIAIQNYAQAARRRLESGTDDRSRMLDLLRKIEAQSSRAGAITQKVRSLINRSDRKLQAVPVDSLLNEVVDLIEPEFADHGCGIELVDPNDLPPVLADPLEIQLVLINLLQNAMHSVCANEGYDKTVYVEVRTVNNRELEISVSDGGHGVPPDRETEIFEPLSSSQNGGMGMGLAISREIVEAHGGRLWHEPNPSGGAIFRFTLQIAER